MTVRQSFRSAFHTGAFTAHVEDGKLVSVTPFEHDPHPDESIHAWPEMVHAGSRVMRPSVRRGWLKRAERDGRMVPEGVRGEDVFHEVPWDEALEMVAGELDRIRKTHGNEALFGGSYGWASGGRLHNAQNLTRRFMWSIGGCTTQVTNYSYGAGMTLLPHVLGSNEAIWGAGSDWRSIAANCDRLVAFGGLCRKNWKVQSGGFGAHGFENVVRILGQAKTKVINVSPLRSDVAPIEAEWLPVRPNSDCALILALIWVVQDKGAEDRAFLDKYTVGADRVLAYVRGDVDGIAKTPAWAAEKTGVPAAEIQALGEDLIGKRVMLTATWSLQRQDHGEQPFWALVALASVLGQVGLPGGGVFFGYGSTGGFGQPKVSTPLFGMPTPRSEGSLGIPVARVADCLLTPGGTFEYDGQEMTFPDIRLVYWAGGNPFHHHQDLNRLRKAFQRPETVIVHEPWWTGTARHADIVLPATTPLERDDYAGSSRDPWILSVAKAVSVGEARDDFAIFSDLADRLGGGEDFHQGLDVEGWLRKLWGQTSAALAVRGVNTPDWDTFREMGYFKVPEPADVFDLYADFRHNPRANKLGTPSGKIELFSETIAGFGYDDCPGHPVWIEPKEWLGKAGDWPLHMLSNQPADKLHSQLDGSSVSQKAKIHDRAELLMNPADAAARGLEDGSVVRVFNARGACLAGLRVSDEIMPGVVRLPTGAMFDPGPDGLERHGNPNVLTRDEGTSRLGQGCSAQSCLVEVEAFTGPVPRVEVFDPPVFIAREA
ncbi:molybdopterin-dependent oxidoreductase [Albimonas pacifica]|uniref:Biotin/methionine sulfoxide reductase n=1 Tax=Albimonas pacifica TaxID=1114924 RepID=A0A1I3BVX8_9RHOB|nr:molybdopterin-dependent oxidoreductase [Albimonas pacifica]SFH66089.1 biotin/methionine sulfoxide reductase [Albimonas pacifica]